MEFFQEPIKSFAKLQGTTGVPKKLRHTRFYKFFESLSNETINRTVSKWELYCKIALKRFASHQAFPSTIHHMGYSNGQSPS
jgi:hypothetical protein